MARSDGPVPAIVGRLRGLNPTTVFLITLAIALAAMLTPGVIGAVIVLAVVGALLALARLTWRFTPLPTKVMRVLILLVLVAVAIVKIIAIR